MNMMNNGLNNPMGMMNNMNMMNQMNMMNNLNMVNQMNQMNTMNGLNMANQINMNNMNMMNQMNMMNNGMMNPMNNVMMNPMNNIMANNMMMNNMMNPMPMMNNVVPMNNQMPQSGNLWNLIFQRKMSRTNVEQTINILIDPDKLFIEAVNMYKIKTGSTDNFKFIFNGKDIIKELKISQTGLMNNSTITVISLSDVEGAKYI